MADIDPVAAKSAFLKMYMSSHPDTLVAYAMHFGKVTDISTAEMSAIDTKSMTLTYKSKSGKDTKVVVVPISPPLKDYNDVKPRLLGMKAEAQEALQMIKAPQLSTFKVPTSAGQVVTTVAILFLIYCTAAFNPNALPNPFNLIARPRATSLFAAGHGIVNFVGGVGALKAAWTFATVVHIGEALFIARLSWKNTTLRVWATYTFATFIFGAPIIADYRRRIQAARINSVMKVQ